eukprot:TRINITY_DN718_c0_g1_i2.p1 TRINITY_DN718_c0_g1~~TRINITY_DN718_c0_g1_i2.p1  ORF type:complete len:124 (+),score=3.42 TRINITY_DN718_c0_g1_i2:121-492(+)
MWYVHMMHISHVAPNISMRESIFVKPRRKNPQHSSRRRRNSTRRLRKKIKSLKIITVFLHTHSTIPVHPNKKRSLHSVDALIVQLCAKVTKMLVDPTFIIPDLLSNKRGSKYGRHPISRMKFE